MLLVLSLEKQSNRGTTKSNILFIILRYIQVKPHAEWTCTWAKFSENSSKAGTDDPAYVIVE